MGTESNPAITAIRWATLILESAPFDFCFFCRMLTRLMPVRRRDGYE
jgi:hypothetical protein